MLNDFQPETPEIPIVDLPLEVSPINQPEVEITNPHPVHNDPGAQSNKTNSNPIGFTAKSQKNGEQKGTRG